MTRIVDDILVTGATEEKHDIAMIQVLERAIGNNIGFNSENFQYKQNEVNFFCLAITEQGISPTEHKLQAIRDIQPFKNYKELHTPLNMIVYLNRYSVKLATLTEPLRELIKKNILFQRQPQH